MKLYSNNKESDEKLSRNSPTLKNFANTGNYNSPMGERAISGAIEPQFLTKGAANLEPIILLSNDQSILNQSSLRDAPGFSTTLNQRSAMGQYH